MGSMLLCKWRIPRENWFPEQVHSQNCCRKPDTPYGVKCPKSVPDEPCDCSMFRAQMTPGCIFRFCIEFFHCLDLIYVHHPHSFAAWCPMCILLVSVWFFMWLPCLLMKTTYPLLFCISGEYLAFLIRLYLISLSVYYYEGCFFPWLCIAARIPQQ